MKLIRKRAYAGKGPSHRCRPPDGGAAPELSQRESQETLSPVPSACGGTAPELSQRESQETLSPVPSACGGAAPELSQRESQESI